MASVVLPKQGGGAEIFCYDGNYYTNSTTQLSSELPRNGTVKIVVSCYENANVGRYGVGVTQSEANSARDSCDLRFVTHWITTVDVVKGQELWVALGGDASGNTGNRGYLWAFYTA